MPRSFHTKEHVYGDFNLVTVDEVESLMSGNTSGRVSRLKEKLS